MKEGAALAVRGAPEPGRAVLAARQQALPVRAQTEPVDAPAVLGADPQGRPAAPHPAGPAGGEEKAAPARKEHLGIRNPWGCVLWPSQGAGAPGSCRDTGRGGARWGAAHKASQTADPVVAAHLGSPMLVSGSPSPTGAERLPSPYSLRRPAPHLSRPLPPGPWRAKQRRLRARWEPRISLWGADGGGNPGSQAPCAPSRASAARAREVECRTIQSSLAPPQRPPLNLSPPTSRACAPAPTLRSRSYWVPRG